MAIAELDEEKTEKGGMSMGNAMPTATGIAYTRDGDGVAEERLGATDASASLSSDTQSAVRMKALDQIRELQQKVDEIKASAAARGEPMPNIEGLAALSTDPTALSGQDLALLQQQLDRVEQSVAGEQGKQLQQSMGDMVGLSAALGAMAGSAGMLAALGISGGQNVSGAAYFNGIDHGIGAMGLQQQKDKQASLPDM